MRSPSYLGLEIWLKPSESMPDRGREYVCVCMLREYVCSKGNILLENSLISCQMFDRNLGRSFL